MNNTILRTVNLSKSFGEIKALQDINLSFKENNIYGLFGRNGAGKTTLLNILSSRIFPDSGEVYYSDRIQPITRGCCYMAEKHYFPSKMKMENILNAARTAFPLYDVPYADTLCSRFHLKIGQRYDQLSRGQQSLLRIVLGLASRSPVTIFDEPTLGLDAAARDSFYEELITEFSRNPRLIILSTHLIDESADLFNEAIILRDGKIIQQGEIGQLLARFYSVTGKADRVENYITGRKVHLFQIVNNQATAIVEEDVENLRDLPGLHFSFPGFQQLFICLTEKNGEEK